MMIYLVMILLLQIKRSDNKLSLKIEVYDTSKIAIGERFISSYIIEVDSNDYCTLESFRMKIIDHLKGMKFSTVSILKDDVSKEIASHMYPLIYEIENELREYLIFVLTGKIGEEFIRYVVPKETLDKAKGLKSNEPNFINSNKVQNDIALLYFDALGSIVYGESIFSKAKATSILEKIREATDLDKWKSDLLDGNYQKYFKDSFEKADFKAKWDKILRLRNKVAHNSYFIEQEKKDCEQLCNDLHGIISRAYTDADKLQLSLADMENLKIAVDDLLDLKIDPGDIEVVKSFDVDNEKTENSVCLNKLITEEELLNQLDEASSEWEFVGFKHFANDKLVHGLGYSYESVTSMINIFIEKKVIETYKENNPFGEHDTTAIRRKDERV